MKRLIALITSAVLLCPILAGAQTTPTIAGTLTWTLNPGVTSGTTTLYSPEAQGSCPINGATGKPVCSETGTATAVKLKASISSYTGGMYLMSSQVTFDTYSYTSYMSNQLTYAALGSMQYSDGYYQMYISAYGYAMNCTLSSTTLSGTCVGSNGSQSPITLVTD